jgi:hypothetical protein
MQMQKQKQLQLRNAGILRFAQNDKQKQNDKPRLHDKREEEIPFGNDKQKLPSIPGATSNPCIS